MIDRKKAILLSIVLFTFLILSIQANAATGSCIYAGEPQKTGFIYANMFVCPHDPETATKPKCPTDTEYTKFSGGTGRYYDGYITQPDTYTTLARGNGTGVSNFAINFPLSNLTNICYEGMEGDYFLWYQVGVGSGPDPSPSEGRCSVKTHTVSWDGTPSKYCTAKCVDESVDWVSGTSLPCCGDDNATSADGFDCAKSASSGGKNYVCTSSGEQWKWFRADTSAGDIKELSCANVSVVSNGNAFLSCANQAGVGIGLTPLTFAYIQKSDKQHAYTCFNDSNVKKIAECTGAGSRFSTAGVIKEGGESVYVGSKVYYCMTNRSMPYESTLWWDDLDNIGNENRADCTTAKKPDGKAGGYVWTGNKCCKEIEDVHEYYNDREGYNATASTPGGCWDSKHIFAGEPIPLRLLVDVVNYNGGFEGCAITDPALLGIEDSHTHNGVVRNNEYCTVLESARGKDTHLYCSFNGNWVETTNPSQSKLKTTLWDASKGCCSESQCWNGAQCIDNQLYSSAPTTYHGFRCINGNWSNSTMVKYTWNSDESGYCSSADQCLVNPSPNAPVNCIASGSYDGNKYCDGGDWTSRTKLLAVALLQYASSKSPQDYTLFCDNYQNILNYYNYAIGGDSVLNYVGETQCAGKPCINEFCVLKYQDSVVFGASINTEIDSERSFLKALNKSSTLCNSAKINDNQYHQCSGEKIWYNHAQGTIIQLSENEPLGAVSWTEAFIAFIRNPFNTIKNWIVPKDSSLGFFNQTRMFTKIYADVKGSKKVFAFLEEDQTVYLEGWPLRGVDYLGLEYTGLGVTPCGLIRNYDSSISCTSDQTIFAQSKVGSQKNLVDAWPDLTAKLRLR